MSNNNDGDLDDLPPMQDDDHGRLKVKKGQEISLTRIDPTMREITIGVGWDVRRYEGDPVDVDVSVFLLNKNSQTTEDSDFIFYNNLNGRDGAVRHQGDSRTGAGDGDDEKITIDLMALPFEVVKIAFVLSVYDMDMNSNNDLSLVRNAYFRIVNNFTEHEVLRFELDEDSIKARAVIIGYMERVGSEWTCKAEGEPIPGGLSKIASQYGIVVVENMRN